MFKNTFFLILAYGVAIVALGVASLTFLTVREFGVYQPRDIIRTVVVSPVPVVVPTASPSATATPVKRVILPVKSASRTP